MVRAGRTPAPTAVRVLQGQKPYRINRDEPEPADKRFVPPDWLSPYAREEWDRIESDVLVMGVAKHLDSTSLSAWCEAVSRFREATQNIKLLGIMAFDDKGNPVKNPACMVARDSSAEMLRWAREFGFTPSSRQTLRRTTSTVDASPTTMHQLLSG